MLSIHPRIRIGIVLLASFFVSGLIMKYTSDSPTHEAAPHIQLQTLASDLTTSIADSKSSILTTIQSFRLPALISFNPHPQPFQEDPLITPTEAPFEDLHAEPTQGWITLPTSPPQSPTPPSTHIIPTSSTNSTNPTPRPTTNTSPIPPTTIPKPTKTPKPTKPPKPTPYPAITTDERPGSTIQEVAREVGKRACFPYALLMATRTQESGAWMNGMSASTTKKYNTYGWWKSASSGEVCAALAYSTQSGLVPSDSGGGSCTNGVQPGAYDQKIMGLMQVSEEEETKTRKYTQATLPNSIDRRVLFDNMLIYAIATRNRLGVTPPGCDDWPQDIVKLAAEKHFGACAYGNGKNYCTEVWNLYRSFK